MPACACEARDVLPRAAKPVPPHPAPLARILSVVPSFRQFGLLPFLAVGTYLGQSDWDSQLKKGTGCGSRCVVARARTPVCGAAERLAQPEEEGGGKRRAAAERGSRKGGKEGSRCVSAATSQ
eukprot:3006593-Rhodomonas_salina.2